jgi:hypothetical protein
VNGIIENFMSRLGITDLQEWLDDLAWWFTKPDMDDHRLSSVDGDGIDELVNWQLGQGRSDRR